MELIFFFFFQAEDGIRDVAVTGVQTCALPISAPTLRDEAAHSRRGHPAVWTTPWRRGEIGLRILTRGPMDLNGQVAIVGIGHSEFGRYLPISQLGLGAKALRAALADAGI